MKTEAIVVQEHGGPEVLRWETLELPEPGAGQVMLRHTSIGLNFIDTYFRQGLYPAELPFVPGVEAVGTIEDIRGPAPGLRIGQRVAYPFHLGAYCRHRWIPVSALVPVPDSLDDATVAGSLLKGMTAYYLLNHTYPVSADDKVLIHAAAGGVGSILCPWAKSLGATVIGTAGSDEKVRLALDLGCDFAINYQDEEVVRSVETITHGTGVDVVFDGVGQATFEASLACLKEEGMMVSFGNASGPVPPVRPLDLTEKALYLTRPSLKTYIRRPEFMRDASRTLFELLSRGVIPRPAPSHRPLEDVGVAHAELESRKTVGSTVLDP